MFRDSGHAHAAVDSFNSDGCIIDLRIFDELEIAEHRRYFERLLEDVMARGGTSKSISSAHLKCGRVFDLMHDPRIVSRVRNILGDEIVGLASQLFCRCPTTRNDDAYGPLTPSKTMPTRRMPACVSLPDPTTAAT